MFMSGCLLALLVPTWGCRVLSSCADRVAGNKYWLASESEASMFMSGWLFAWTLSAHLGLHSLDFLCRAARW